MAVDFVQLGKVLAAETDVLRGSVLDTANKSLTRAFLRPVVCRYPV